MESDFLPFKLLADLPWGMTSHLLFPAIDEQWPATLSEKIIGRIIREWIGFNGLLVTDCLFMEALSGSIPERVQRCLCSGCDVALHSHGELADLERAVEGLQPINDLFLGKMGESSRVGKRKNNSISYFSKVIVKFIHFCVDRLCPVGP